MKKLKDVRLSVVIEYVEVIGYDMEKEEYVLDSARQFELFDFEQLELSYDKMFHMVLTMGQNNFFNEIKKIMDKNWGGFLDLDKQVKYMGIYNMDENFTEKAIFEKEF